MSGKGGKPDPWDCCRSWLNMVLLRSSQSKSSMELGGVCEPHHRLQRCWEVMLVGEEGPVFFRGVVPGSLTLFQCMDPCVYWQVWLASTGGMWMWVVGLI